MSGKTLVFIGPLLAMSESLGEKAHHAERDGYFGLPGHCCERLGEWHKSLIPPVATGRFMAWNNQDQPPATVVSSNRIRFPNGSMTSMPWESWNVGSIPGRRLG